MVEPIGVMGILAPPSRPLLGSIALLAPAIAMGNPVVLVPSEKSPLSVTDLYQVIETSDVPSGVINIVTGPSASLAKTLAEHDGVDALVVRRRCGHLGDGREGRRSATSSRPGPAAASITTSATRPSSKATISSAAPRR